MSPAHATLPEALTKVPPLENGDRLTRAEFERRYEAMPELRKAELIEGIAYMPSPVRLRLHARPHSHMNTWLGTYEARTPGLILGDNSTVRVDLDNEPQPDVLLLVDPALGGQARISDDDYVEGAPELVAEVAASSASYDVGAKLEAHRRNGVREYVVHRVLDGEIDWYVLRGEGYEKLATRAGISKSETFPGLWLDAAALVRGDLAVVLDVLGEGLARAEHDAFVRELKAKKP
jgi:Uma2 family endonuclease